jgi:hypothetical protein
MDNNSWRLYILAPKQHNLQATDGKSGDVDHPSPQAERKEMIIIKKIPINLFRFILNR